MQRNVFDFLGFKMLICGKCDIRGDRQGSCWNDVLPAATATLGLFSPCGCVCVCVWVIVVKCVPGNTYCSGNNHKGGFSALPAFISVCWKIFWQPGTMRPRKMLQVRGQVQKGKAELMVVVGGRSRPPPHTHSFTLMVRFKERPLLEHEAERVKPASRSANCSCESTLKQSISVLGLWIASPRIHAICGRLVMSRIGFFFVWNESGKYAVWKQLRLLHFKGWPFQAFSLLLWSLSDDGSSYNRQIIHFFLS